MDDEAKIIPPSFARLYAAHAAQFTEDLPFWRSLAKSSGSPILELGCGPGRVLLDLAKKGWTVTGLDADEDMLNWARSHVPERLLNKITLIQADMRSFHLPDQYPLVLVPCNTFAYFDGVDALQLLQGVKRHLTQRGRLAIALPNPAQYASYQDCPYQFELSYSEPINDFIEPNSGHPVQVYAYEELDRETSILQVLWAFDELFPDGKVIRLEHSIRYHLRTPKETFELIHLAQMIPEQVYGDYRRGPLDQNSLEMIIVARNADENG